MTLPLRRCGQAHSAISCPACIMIDELAKRHEDLYVPCKCPGALKAGEDGCCVTCGADVSREIQRYQEGFRAGALDVGGEKGLRQAMKRAYRAAPRQEDGK